MNDGALDGYIKHYLINIIFNVIHSPQPSNLTSSTHIFLLFTTDQMKGGLVQNKVNDDCTICMFEAKSAPKTKQFKVNFKCTYTDRVNTVSVTMLFFQESISAMLLLKEYFNVHAAAIGFDRNTEIASAHVTPYGCTFMTTDKKVLDNVHAILKYMVTKKLPVRYSRMYGMDYDQIIDTALSHMNVHVVGKCKLFYEAAANKTPAGKKRMEQFIERLNKINVPPVRERANYAEKVNFTGYILFNPASMEYGTFDLKKLILALKDTDMWYDRSVKRIMGVTDETIKIMEIVKNQKRINDIFDAHEKRFGQLGPTNCNLLKQALAPALYTVRGCEGPAFIGGRKK